MLTIEQVAISAKIIGETERAWLLFDGLRKVWLPKDLVEYDARAMVVTIPGWLATEKRLR